MYTFTNREIAGLTVSNTIAKQNTEHHKAYQEVEVTPQTQNTLNVYVSGSFLISAGSWSQILSEGNTSLDLSIIQYPIDQPVIEKVQSPWGNRFCVSCKKSWEKELFELNTTENKIVIEDSLLILLSGQFKVANILMKPVSFRLVIANTEILAQANSKAILCKVKP